VSCLKTLPLPRLHSIRTWW